MNTNKVTTQPDPVPAKNVMVSKYGTIATLANAVQLGTNVIKEISGNEIANGFDGEEITDRELANIFSAKVLGYLNKNKSGGQK